jgi:hypothetical protein
MTETWSMVNYGDFCHLNYLNFHPLTMYGVGQGDVCGRIWTRMGQGTQDV